MATCVDAPPLELLGEHTPRSGRAQLRRLALPVAGVAALVAVMLTVRGPGEAIADAFARALAADPLWIVAGLGLEILSFAGYASLFWLVGSRATARLGPLASLQITLAGAAATRLLPTGGAGGVALTIWALRRAGLPGRAATHTLLSFLALLYAVFFGAILLAGALLATGAAVGDAPLLLAVVPAATAGAAIAIGLALSFAHGAVDRLPGRAHGAGRALADAVRDARGLLREADFRLLGAFAWWGFDVAVLWATFHAFGAPPPLAVLVLSYFVGQVGNTLPLPGAVSGGILGVLLASGVPADLALPSVLAYRAVAVWTPAPAGAAALAGLRRAVARWGREDGSGAVRTSRRAVL